MSEFTTPARKVTARVDHDCCCYDIYADSGYGMNEIPEKYHDAINRMKEQKGKIKKGDECYYWSGRFDGEFFHAYADPEMLDLIYDMGWDEQ